ncbi:MAG TPA: hypothetical protein VL171_18865 [Verrucomicrobiae bacterium]|nr:hypothetical protein [Verrucomicrobiae bacterium]
MKQMIKALWFGSVASLMCFLAAAHADVIDFDSQGLFGPPYFADAGPAQTISVTTSVGLVTFEGGVILTAEDGNANTTSVYATGHIFDLTNIITIAFPAVTSNFSITVGNDEPFSATYVLANSMGTSQSVALAMHTATQVIIPSVGTMITISAVIDHPGSWDFSIDNISFEAIPEPSALSLLVLSMAMMALSVICNTRLPLLRRHANIRFSPF